MIIMVQCMANCDTFSAININLSIFPLCFLVCFFPQSRCIQDNERAGVVAKLVEFLQHFLSHNPTTALDYLQTKVDLLE